MHSASLHVGYLRSPFKFPAFINALLFLCHASGSKLFPGGNVLLRPSSYAGLHSRYLLRPSTNAGPLPSSNAGMYPSSNAGLCPSSNVRLCPSSNAGLCPRCHRSPWFKKVLAELNARNALYGARHSRLSFMPDCFRGGAPPRLQADFCEYFLLVQFILCRDI